MTDQELKDLVGSLAIQSAKTDEELRKLAIQSAKSNEEFDRRLKKISKLVGNIGNNQGDVAEEFFYNSLASKSTLNGIEYDFVDKNVVRYSKKDNIKDEYDILMINGKDIAIIETKYKAHTQDVEKLVGTKYNNFKKLYPEYKNYNHHLGLASFYVNEDVLNLAKQNKVMVLQRKGDLIETI
jgi:hypothetical protein